MKKFLLPIMNLVNVVLVSIVFGLGAQTAALRINTEPKLELGNWYQLVWQGSYVEFGKTSANVLGIIGFFLFVLAVAAILVAFFPTKFRKWVAVGAGAALIAAGVLFLLTPKNAGLGDAVVTNLKLTSELIGMSVLAFVSGAVLLGMAAIEIVPMFLKKEAK